MTAAHHSINYVELPSTNLAATKAFYGAVFGWTFQDWGPTYISIHGAGVDGGFTTDGTAPSAESGPLVIMFSNDLEATLDAVKAAGGDITQPIFSYPGGRRFHFLDPSGNALAVWSHEKGF
ncbi:MAG: VOC family protein [Sphingomonadales bacterium]